MKETILQFGTGNFLRAFADEFIDRLLSAGLTDGKIVIVSPTDSKNVALLQAQNCRWHVLLRGVRDGETVDESRLIRSVSRAVNPYRAFPAFLALARLPELGFVISNTTEAGIRFDPACRLEDAPAASFPGKVTQLLWERYRAGLPGLVFFPCELIDDNARRLQEAVLQYASLWELPAAFAAWIEQENAFCATLVDRIVTGKPETPPLLPGGAPDCLADAAEPYCFWAIEGDYEAELPFRKAGLNVVWTKDISFYKKRKVRLLNGAHTAVVFPALLAGLETVGDCLADPLTAAFLKQTLFGAALPLLGDTAENRAFANAVLERFANPFIRHRLSSIALNSVSKFTVRVLPTLLEAREKTGGYPKPLLVSLACLIRYYKTREPQDDPAAVRRIRAGSLPEILSDRSLWGVDLSPLYEALAPVYGMEDAREAMRWSLS